MDQYNVQAVKILGVIALLWQTEVDFWEFELKVFLCFASLRVL